MARFLIGLGILFSIIIVIPVVREITPTIITVVIGTTAGSTMFTYLVPATIVIGGLAAIFMTWFRPRKERMD